MKPIFFRSPAELREWFEENHAKAKEVLVGYYKKGSGRPTIAWPESVDEALCVGWIDGKRKRIDDESYMIRFTPRRRGSNWSRVNRRRVKALQALGRMKPAGLAAFATRNQGPRSAYSYEDRKRIQLDPALERHFRREAGAWAFFRQQPLGYRDLVVFYIMSAKKEETRERRMRQVINLSRDGRRLSLGPDRDA